MKIAAVTNNGNTISAHFGRARSIVVVTVEQGQIVQREQRDRSEQDDARQSALAHGQQGGIDQHDLLINLMRDCDAVLARGMGMGMHQRLQQAGIRPVLTDMANIDEAVTAFVSGHLEEHPERVH